MPTPISGAVILNRIAPQAHPPVRSVMVTPPFTRNRPGPCPSASTARKMHRKRVLLTTSCQHQWSPFAELTRGRNMSSKTLPAPADAALRRAAKPTIAYPAGAMPRPDMAVLDSARRTMVKIYEVVVPPRDARSFRVSRGQFFRIVSIEGPQVGDLNLWNADDLCERFFSGKTRALHATHVGAGDRLWSTMPYLSPIVTISHDTLSWYGWDWDGAGVHDVIGTRCDPYTNLLLSGTGYDFC